MSSKIKKNKSLKLDIPEFNGDYELGDHPKRRFQKDQKKQQTQIKIKIKIKCD
jgi:hypothetical protein